MPITPLPPYIPPFGPTPNITPFNYRDGRNYLRKIEDLIKYLNRVVIPNTNEAWEALALAFEEQVNILIAEVNTQLAAQDVAVTEQLEQQNADVAAQLAAQNALVTQQLADQDAAVEAQLDAQNTAVTNQLAAQDIAIADQLADQNTAVTNQLAAQDATVADQLSDQNTAVANQLSAQNTAVTNQLDAQDAAIAAEIATVQTVAFADPVIDAVITDTDSGTRTLLDGLYAAPAVDTGWVDLTLDAAFTGFVRYRAVGDTVSIAVDVTGAAGTLPEADTDLTADLVFIPAEYRPTQAPVVASATLTPIDMGLIYVNPAGLVRFNNGDALTTRAIGTITYQAG
jgi:hypothetical protein